MLTIHVIGAGPAGASLAYFLRDCSVKVIVYEVMQEPGSKPCGCGVPNLVREHMVLENRFIINRVDGYRVFLNGEPTVEYWSREAGYIINKKEWLKSLLEKSRAEVHYCFKGSIPKPNPQNKLVIAMGHYWEHAPQERVNTMSTIVSEANIRNPEIVEFWFNSTLLGYYWVFPYSHTKANVGIGGYAKFSRLKEMLLSFIRKHQGLAKGKLGPIRGAQLVASGLNRELLKPSPNTYVVGEAAGAVFPLTGEGIRPSIMTSKALSMELLGYSEYETELKKMSLLDAMDLHRTILGLLRKIKPDDRVKLIRMVGRETLVEVGLGIRTSLNL